MRSDIQTAEKSTADVIRGEWVCWRCEMRKTAQFILWQFHNNEEDNNNKQGSMYLNTRKNWIRYKI